MFAVVAIIGAILLVPGQGSEIDGSQYAFNGFAGGQAENPSQLNTPVVSAPAREKCE
jgi:hypothetical protein